MPGATTHFARRMDIGDDTHAATRGISGIISGIIKTIADATIELPRHYIEIEGSLVQRALLTLKDGDAFAVFDNYGDIGVIGTGPEGLYFNDTRFLSRYELRFEGKRPLLLSSVVQDDNAALSVTLTNPDVHIDGIISLPRDTIAIERTKFLWQAVCYERMGFRNYADSTRHFRFDIEFGADFRDVFEIRGTSRERRGTATPLVTEDGAEFRYEGLDNVKRKTELRFWPPPSRLETNRATFEFELAPNARRSLFISILCEDRNEPRISPFGRAFRARRRAIRGKATGIATIESSNELFNEVCRRATADLYMLMTRTSHGLYPYAGIPWYSTAFGRDGIITAMLLLWLDPSVAKGVLHFLAATQAKTFDPLAGAQPGKILHETRNGEMARLGEVPFGLYYGTVDATPLYVMLAGMYFDRTGDIETIAAIWPNIKAALHWIDTFGDADGDGFVEYARQNTSGLVNQGWKDLMIRFSTPMARWPKGRSRFAKCRATCSRPRRMPRNSRIAWVSMISKPACAARRKVCKRISRRRFGARILAHMPWRSMEIRVRAVSAHPMRAMRYSPGSPRRNGRHASPGHCLAGIRSAVGGSERSRAARRGSIRFPITTARSGRTTTR